MRFVRGSHRWTKNYRAVHFDPELRYANLPDHPEPPDWNVGSDDHEIVYAPLEPGDCLIIHNRTHHSAPGNSLTSTRRRALATHWIGDDITYNDKPQETDPLFFVRLFLSLGPPERGAQSASCRSGPGPLAATRPRYQYLIP